MSSDHCAVIIGCEVATAPAAHQTDFCYLDRCAAVRVRPVHCDCDSSIRFIKTEITCEPKMGDPETKKLIASLQEQRESINKILQTQEDLFIKLNKEVVRMQNSHKRLQLQVTELREYIKRRGPEDGGHNGHGECESGTNRDKNKVDEVQAVNGETEESDFRRVGLEIHNLYRSKHSARPLKLDPELNKNAQSYAELLAQMNQMVHSLGDLGENMYYCDSNQMDKSEVVKTAVAEWYNEVNLYDWGYPGYTSGTGQFSQLVWKSSSRLGIGVAYSEKGGIYVVANYDPCGNAQGRFAENVTNS